MGPNGPAKSLGAPTALSQGMGLKQMCKLAPGKSECKSEILRQRMFGRQKFNRNAHISKFAFRFCSQVLQALEEQKHGWRLASTSLAAWALLIKGTS